MSTTLPPVPMTVPVLQGERVAFTGILASMTHQQAAELAVQHGGIATTHVSRETTLLVVGEEGWPLEADGRISAKLEQSQRYHAAGCPLRILGESEWLAVLGLEEQARQSRRLYTPAMLSQLLNLSVHAIRRWERLGLIQPVKRVYRLPYFDVQEVTNVRKLSELVEAGIPVDEIALGLNRLNTLLPDVARPLAQLEILALDHQLLRRDEHGLIEARTGQRRFLFDEEDLPESSSADEHFTDSAPETLPFPGNTNRARWSAAEWFREGVRLADTPDSDADLLQAAIHAYRLAILEVPTEPEWHFHLADALYRSGQPAAAAERYFMAVALDHAYIEAWTQLGCVLCELGQTDSAIDAFQTALDVHPDYADAHWHLAEALFRIGRKEEAIAHWRHYLASDARGPWANTARQRISSQSPDRTDPPLELPTITDSSDHEF